MYIILVLFLGASFSTVYALEGDGQSDPPVKLQNPLGANVTSLCSFIKTFFNNVVIPIGGVIAVFMIIYCGFLFVTAQGNTTKLETAKNAFLWTVIGTAILLGSWVIANGIQGTINQITGGTNTSC